MYSYVLGAISAASTLGPPGKPPQLEDSYSPYNLMSDSPASPLVAPDSWGQGKSPNEKISNGTNINWPPGEDETQITVNAVHFKELFYDSSCPSLF